MLMGDELSAFLGEGLRDLQATAGVSVTLKRDGHGAVSFVGTITPGAAAYQVEIGGVLYSVVATGIVPVDACGALGRPKVGDLVQASGGQVYKVTGVRGSTVDPAWHVDLASTSRT